MKTQINTLRSGTKNQLLNSEVDYSALPKATSHNGHAGSNNDLASTVWDAVVCENKSDLKIKIKGTEFTLTASWSVSGKSVNYTCNLTNEQLSEMFFITPSKNGQATLSVGFSNRIEVRNGKNSYCYLCPSLIEIL